MAKSVRTAIIPLYLLACLLLGGSTRAPIPNMLLQLGAITILAWAGLAIPRVEPGRYGLWLLILVAAMVLVVVLQFLPLPPEIWTAIPGRNVVARGFDLLNVPRPWLSWSLTPYESAASALWLLPPLAVLAGVLRLGAYREPWFAYAVLAAVFVGVMLGVLQVSGADSFNSAWYPYAITNNGQPTGQFANSNHMAALLVTAVPFVVALSGVSNGSKRRVQSSAGRFAVLAGVMLVILVGIALNHSLAGAGLAIPVFAASLLVREPIARARTRWGLVGVAVLAALAIALMFSNSMGNNLTKPGAEKDYSSRYTSFTHSLQATGEAFPVGFGLWSFNGVYPSYEDPTLVDNWFVNHVHNDYIELALETGLPGLLLVTLFLIWWAGRTLAVWKAPVIDPFARAASLASGALLAHSLVEFPLRVSALSAVFAMCIALMTGPRRIPTGAAVDRMDDDGTGPRHLSIS